MIKRYTKKPITVEAVYWNGHNFDEIQQFCLPSKAFKKTIDTGIGGVEAFFIETLEGDMQAQIGDFIIRGVEGECYPCRGSIFEKTYEEIV